MYIKEPIEVWNMFYCINAQKKKRKKKKADDMALKKTNKK